MTLVAVTICLFTAAIGALGIISPPALIRITRRIQTPIGIYLAAGIRLVLGVALLYAAPTSRAPDFIFFLGLLMIVIAFTTPLFGLERFRRLLDWWVAQGPAFLRGWAVLALLFGLSLVYVLVP